MIAKRFFSEALYVRYNVRFVISDVSDDCCRCSGSSFNNCCLVALLAEEVSIF